VLAAAFAPDANVVGQPVQREKPFYRHNSNAINFDDPFLQPGQGDIRSNRQQRDDERLGREAPEAKPARRAKPPKKKRTESVDLDLPSFSAILAEADTQTTKTQSLPDAVKQQKLVANEFFKTLARYIASNKALYTNFMKYNRITDASDTPGQGNQTWIDQRPNRTTPTQIDRNHVNDVLVKDLEMPKARIEEIRREIVGMSPEQAFEKLRQVVKQDEALKIVAALLKTTEA
jgi:hypothetical protein